MYLKSFCYLNTMILLRIRMNISPAFKSFQVTNPKVFYLLVSWMTHGWMKRKKFQSTSCTPRTWAIINIVIFVRMMWRIEISQEMWSAGSVTSSDHKQLSKTMKCRHITNWWMNVINTSCRVKKLIFDSQTNDTKCRYRSSCTLTSSQPLMKRTNTNPSC